MRQFVYFGLVCLFWFYLAWLIRGVRRPWRWKAVIFGLLLTASLVSFADAMVNEGIGSQVIWVVVASLNAWGLSDVIRTWRFKEKKVKPDGSA